MLSRSHSDCQSLTLNVIFKVQLKIIGVGNIDIPGYQDSPPTDCPLGGQSWGGESWGYSFMHLSLLLLLDHKIARCRPTRKPRCVPPFLKVRTHCLFIRHFDLKELLSNRQVVCLIPLRPPKSICSQRRGRLPPTRCPLDQTNQGWRSWWYIYYDAVSVCLCVTKNEHSFLGVSCNHLSTPIPPCTTQG